MFLLQLFNPFFQINTYQIFRQFSQNLSLILDVNSILNPNSNLILIFVPYFGLILNIFISIFIICFNINPRFNCNEITFFYNIMFFGTYPWFLMYFFSNTMP